MPPSVTALPAEILLQIIDHLLSLRDRLSLARASSRLYSNLRSSAYAYLELSTCTPRKLEQLIYFLSRYFSLARVVQHLRLGQNSLSTGLTIPGVVGSTSPVTSISVVGNPDDGVKKLVQELSHDREEESVWINSLYQYQDLDP